MYQSPSVYFLYSLSQETLAYHDPRDFCKEKQSTSPEVTQCLTLVQSKVDLQPCVPWFSGPMAGSSLLPFSPSPPFQVPGVLAWLSSPSLTPSFPELGLQLYFPL